MTDITVPSVSLVAPPVPPVSPPPAPIVEGSAAERMLSYLPRYYDGSSVMLALLAAQGGEIDLLREAIDELLDQFFVRTATDWGLERWENELGLVPQPAESDADRADRIVSKIRGWGTANKELIKSVAESYVYGLIEVEDVTDNPGAALADYTIRISFIDEHGIPANMVDVVTALSAVVPAHLDIDFVFNYTTWDEIDTVAAGAPRTWDQWDTADGGGPYTWDEMEVLL